MTWRAALLPLAAALLAAGCGGDDVAYRPIEVDELRLPGRVEGPQLAVATGDGFEPRFWPGVNLGATIPGRQPGEVAPSRADYDRWLEGIGELGARVVRIYTILRPSFYDALAAYNDAHPDEPIFLVHGIWIPEEEFIATQNAYSEEVTEAFRAEIADAARVVHGDADLPERAGHASGMYRTDVSRWLLAWSPGVEWDPAATKNTDDVNRGQAPYEGTYVTATAEATPMESWIASMLDYLAGLDAERGWSRPLTFTNWLTVDPLDHDGWEPLPQEDLVSVDATHIRSTDRWPGGFFASYHAYPYYPDFLRTTPEYQEYRRPSDGEIDPYSGYLHALREHHGEQAVMITEFGVPSGIGVAHRGPLGRDQGGHSEQEQGEIASRLLRNIEEEGYAGGILFEWLDEWFKLTWNTVELELPEGRRQLWRNDLTNEEMFGIVAAEPRASPVVTLDGEDREWEENGSQVILESQDFVREVRAVKDEQYLYLRLVLDRPSWWQETGVVVGLDVRPGGNRGLPGLEGVMPEADAAVEIGPGEQAKMWQAAWWEPTRIRYGIGFDYIEVDPADFEPESGVWVSPLQILNRPYTLPATGELHPVELDDQGELRFGNGEDDVRNLVAADDEIVELRLPYAYLGFSDPSSLTLFAQTPDAVGTAAAGRIGIGVASRDGGFQATSGYGWEAWNAVEWRERRKAGFDEVARTMRDLG